MFFFSFQLGDIVIGFPITYISLNVVEIIDIIWYFEWKILFVFLELPLNLVTTDIMLFTNSIHSYNAFSSSSRFISLKLIYKFFILSESFKHALTSSYANGLTVSLE